MILADIVGYRLDMVRCAALRSLYRRLAGNPLRPADTTALLLLRDSPGCDQSALGRALAGNRSVGMKVASRLEARGYVQRREGRDRRSKGLYLTPVGETALAEVLRHHERAELLLATYLTPRERTVLLTLLDKVERAVLEEENTLAGQARAAHAALPVVAPAGSGSA
ncbi:MarR family winged helix-turn-helix transcriptional regulator [Sphingomonas sp. RT2P30]|uniref:MarR family winged helix-turn-helix transcriptional regulator n=1 Tax=Parasphingomonas halimpatiens TaxID=3096162 RepID=UPI002FC949EA